MASGADGVGVCGGDGDAETADTLMDPNRFIGTEAIQDPYPLYEQMRAESHVHRIGDSDFYAVCGWDAIIEAVARTGVWSSWT